MSRWTRSPWPGTRHLWGRRWVWAEFALSGDTFRPVRTLAQGTFAHALAVSADGKELSVGTLDQGVRHVALESAARLRNASISVEGTDGSAQRIDQFLPVPGALFVLADGKLAARSGTAWRDSTAKGTASQTLTDRNVSALAFDDKGALFIGYFDRGLDVLASGTVKHFEDDRPGSASIAWRSNLRRRTMAAATANGTRPVRPAGQPEANADAARRADFRACDGCRVHARRHSAGDSCGHHVRHPRAATDSLYAFQGLVNNHVYALAADPATDHVLAGTLGGLSMLDAEQVRRNLTAANSGLKHNWITAVAQAAPGEWLVGTYGAGVQRVSAEGAFSAIDLPAGMRHDLVINPNALLVTPTHVYAGTLGHGMLVYSVASGRWTSVTAGLPSLNVTAFAARDGELYVGTENGLVRVAEAAL